MKISSHCRRRSTNCEILWEWTKKKRHLLLNESSKSSTFKFLHTDKLQNKRKLLRRTNWRSKWEFKIAHSRMCIGYKAKKLTEQKMMKKNTVFILKLYRQKNHCKFFRRSEKSQNIFALVKFVLKNIKEK